MGLGTYPLLRGCPLVFVESFIRGSTCADVHMYWDLEVRLPFHILPGPAPVLPLPAFVYKQGETEMAIMCTEQQLLSCTIAW